VPDGVDLHGSGGHLRWGLPCSTGRKPMRTRVSTPHHIEFGNGGESKFCPKRWQTGRRRHSSEPTQLGRGARRRAGFAGTATAGRGACDTRRPLDARGPHAVPIGSAWFAADAVGAALAGPSGRGGAGTRAVLATRGAAEAVRTRRYAGNRKPVAADHRPCLSHYRRLLPGQPGDGRGGSFCRRLTLPQPGARTSGQNRLSN